MRAARRIGRRRVKWPRRRPRLRRVRVRRCLYRWRQNLRWWLCGLAKVVSGNTPVWWEGRPKQQCEDPLLDLWGGGQSEAELNKRVLAGLGELLRSVTSSPPARREDGARGQQTQLRRRQQGQKNRRTKRRDKRDNSTMPTEINSNDFGPFLYLIRRIRIEFCRRGN